jgi:hypothetical protein
VQTGVCKKAFSLLPSIFNHDRGMNGLSELIFSCAQNWVYLMEVRSSIKFMDKNFSKLLVTETVNEFSILYENLISYTISAVHGGVFVGFDAV